MSVPQHEKTDVPYGENALEKPHSGVSYSPLLLSSVVVSQQRMLNKVSLNRSTRKTRVCVDWFKKVLWPKARRNLALISPGEQWFSVGGYLIKHPKEREY